MRQCPFPPTVVLGILMNRRMCSIVAAIALLMVWVPAAVGDSAVQFTSYPEEDAFPAWAPDGTEIAFSHGGAFDWKLWVKPISGGDARALVSGDGNQTRASWSPDGAYLAFESGGAIWSVPSSGGTPSRVTDPEHGLVDSEPAWSPNGDLIAFTSKVTSDGAYQIFLARPFESIEDRLTIMSWEHRDPTWSPDASQIAFWTGSYLYVVDVATREESYMAYDVLGYREPAWSPDGDWIAFSASRDIWVVPASGGTAVQITDDAANDVYPTWSPDGTKIAFESDRSGNRDIWIIDLPDVPVLNVTWGQIKTKFQRD